MGWLALLVLLTSALPTLAQPSSADQLFQQGKALMAQGSVVEACQKFAESLALAHRGGTLLNLAVCREKEGRYATALRLFQQAREIALKAGGTEREQLARAHIEKIRTRLSWLTVRVVPGAELPDLVVQRDGEDLPRDRWNNVEAVDPGGHTVVATAPGHVRFDVTVVVGDAGDKQVVEIPALAPEAPPAAASPPPATPPRIAASARPAPRAPVPSLTPPVDRPTPALQVRSHGWEQPGVVVRFDVDPLGPGFRTAVGVTLGLFDNVELGVSALLGRTVGFEPQITVFMLNSAWKPLFNIGMPIFFVDGAYAGFRGATGVQWDMSRHFGVFAQVGGAAFVSLPPGYTKMLFLPALGIQGRI